MTKGRDIIKFVKSQLMYTGRIWTFLIDLQAEVWRFHFRIFTVSLSPQNLARLSSVFIMYMLSCIQGHLKTTFSN